MAILPDRIASLKHFKNDCVLPHAHTFLGEESRPIGKLYKIFCCHVTFSRRKVREMCGMLTVLKPAKVYEKMALTFFDHIQINASLYIFIWIQNAYVLMLFSRCVSAFFSHLIITPYYL